MGEDMKRALALFETHESVPEPLETEFSISDILPLLLAFQNKAPCDKWLIQPVSKINRKKNSKAQA